MKEYRTTLLTNLEKSLKQLHTPHFVVETMMYGFQVWLTPPSQCIHAPTFGSLQGPDILLTQAFYEQFHQLSWMQFCLGHISQKWARATQAYQTDRPPNDIMYWVTQVIHQLWIFTRNMWKHRNEIVHGATAEEAANIILRRLTAQVELHYQAYHDNPSYVLPRHSHLFTQRTCLQWIHQSYEYIQCWLQSVDEALALLKFQEAQLQTTASQFFTIPHAAEGKGDDESLDSSFVPHSTIDSSSLTSFYTSTTASLTVSTPTDDATIETTSSNISISDSNSNDSLVDTITVIPIVISPVENS
jgi:hypothetical protein